MTFKDLAAQVVMSKIEGANNAGNAAAALDQLVGGKKGFDLGDIVSRFQGAGGDLASKAKSWLGDGANEPISASQVKAAIGSDEIAAFGRRLGIDADEASHKLAQILPQLIDKSSQGGQLLNSTGAKGFLAGLTAKLLRKSA